MQQVHLKLLSCLLLIICTNGQNYPSVQWFRNYQGPGSMNSWGNLPVAPTYESPPFGQQYGVGYGQVNNAQPPTTQYRTVETKITNTNTTRQEMDASMSAPGRSVIFTENRSNTGSTCYSIMDPAYPFFSFYCSALPQTTFSLPNFFGHKTKEEAATLFSSFELAFHSQCLANMPKFICPLFFPPCGSERTLPCAKLCRDVKDRCSTYDFSAINCDELPEKSEFCPNFLGIATTSGFSSSMHGNYQSTSSNQKSSKTLVNENTDASSSSHSSSIQTSSNSNAGRTKVNIGLYGEGESSTGSLETVTEVPKTTSTASEFSNWNNRGTLNQQWTVGGSSDGLSQTGGSSVLSTANTIKGDGSVYESKATQLQQQNVLDRGVSSSGVISTSVDSSLSNNNDKYVAGSSESTKTGLTGNLHGNNQVYGSDSLSISGVKSTGGASSLYTGSANLGGITTLVSGSSLGTGVQSTGSSSYNSNSNAGGSSSLRTGSTRTGGSTGHSSSNEYGRRVSSSSRSGMRVAGSTLNSQIGNYDTSGAYLITGTPFGLQTTVQYTDYSPEKLDLSKCGPLPSKNPCVINGPQLHGIPDNPHCYIQCFFGLMFMKPCPDGLIWNTLIDVCDWPTVAEFSTDDNSASSPYSTNTTNYQETYYLYRRQKRALKERKAQSASKNPFDSFNRLDVPLGPPIQNTVPLPGFSGPIGIAGPFLPQPPGLPTAAPIMSSPSTMPRYMPPMFDSVQTMRSYQQGWPLLYSPPAAAPQTPKPNLTPPLPPPMPPPIYAKLPPLPKPVLLPPPAPRNFPSTNWPSFPAPSVPSFPSSGVPIATPGSTPTLPPFMPPILPTVPIPLGGPLLPPLPMKIPATYFPGPPPIFRSGSFGPFDAPSIQHTESQGSANGPQVIFRKGSEPQATPFSFNLGGSSGQFSFLDLLRLNGKLGYDDADDEEDDDSDNDNSEETDDSKNTKSNSEKPKDSKTVTNKKTDDKSEKKKQTRRRRKRDLDATQDENKSLFMKNEESSPCIGKAVRTNVPHPTDSTKYVLCLNQNKYEIMDCPPGFIYNAENDKCEKLKFESICEQQPCLNNGQCHPTSATTFTCTCQGSWAGERCETPLSPCASNPCGQGNECIPLVTNDYNQNYICICGKQQSYGLTCEHGTVPNPCSSTSDNQEQYYSFAFSSHAYIRCNGDLIHVQSCAPGLNWNQETKVCERVEIPTFVNPTVPESQSYQTNQNSHPETMSNPRLNNFNNYFMKQPFYPYSNYYSYDPSYPFKTYEPSPMMYPSFPPHQWLKGNRRFRHQRKMTPNEEYGLTESQNSLDSDEDFTQSSYSMPQNPYGHGSTRNLYNLFQLSSSYRR